MSKSLSCPVCDESVENRETNEAFPFCSKRCKRLDLGRWLGEQYAIPITPQRTERRIRERDESEPTPETD